jgi:hypothetical protein
MAAFSVFYDHIMPELKGCTTEMVDLHLLHVARDLCERSSAWRFPFLLSTVASEPTYDISSPDVSSEVVRICRLSIDDVLLFDDEWDQQRHMVSDAAADVQEPKYPRHDPPFSISNDATELTLIAQELPASDGTDNISLTAALKPSFGATVLPDFLKFQHLEALRTGTLSRLMAMAGKPWSAPPQSMLYAAEYQRLVQHAASNARMGNTRRLLRSRPV